MNFVQKLILIGCHDNRNVKFSSEKNSKIFFSEVIRGMKLKLCINVYVNYYPLYKLCFWLPRYTTTDNIFIVNCLKDISKSQKKKLYCTFVDCKQAFDRVWRDGLWAKLYSFRINRKCLNVIKSIYENSKSRIITAEGPSAFLSCNIDVRQGDNLSALFFTVFLNDLDAVFRPTYSWNQCWLHRSVLFKLFILLYADGTVKIYRKSGGATAITKRLPKVLRNMKLTVHTEKTKVMIFSNDRISKNVHFYLNNKELEIVSEFKYFVYWHIFIVKWII